LSNNLLVITSRYPHKFDEISSTFVYNHIEYLRSFFDKVYVLSATPYIPTFFSTLLQPSRRLDSLAEDYTYDNVEVHFLKSYYLPFGIGYSYRGRQCLSLVERHIHDNNITFNLIHAHFSWPSGYVAAALKVKFKVPALLTIHENREWLINEAENNYIREVWSQVDGIIRVNKIDLKLIEKYNRNVVSIPNGYDHKIYQGLSQSEARTKLGISKDENIIFSLGHLIERKGFVDLLNAVKLLRKKRNDFRLYIGGDGPMRSNLQNIISENCLDNVELLGYLPSDELPLWMNASDFFALTSYSEGNPTVMFEALGCGKPVISTKVGGVPEILVSDDYGFLVDNNPADIASKLDLAISKEWDKSKIKKYASNFTWENIAVETLKFYKSIPKKN